MVALFGLRFLDIDVGLLPDLSMFDRFLNLKCVSLNHIENKDISPLSRLPNLNTLTINFYSMFIAKRCYGSKDTCDGI